MNSILIPTATKHSLLGVLAMLIPWWTVGVWAAPLSECENCHKDERYFVEDKKVFNYYQDWLHSPHKQAGLDCSDCHGGDPKATEKTAAHVGIFSVTDPRSKVNFLNQSETCGRCHKEETNQFKASHHYRRLEKHELLIPTHGHAPSCSTCHLAMNRKPYYKTIVEQTCSFCHYENNDAELPMVARETNEILHRLNVSKGYLSWTQLYYKSKGWPESSKEEVDRLISQYQGIVTDLHSFRMRKTEKTSVDLLAQLKQVFAKVAAEEGIAIWGEDEPENDRPVETQTTKDK